MFSALGAIGAVGGIPRLTTVRALPSFAGNLLAVVRPAATLRFVPGRALLNTHLSQFPWGNLCPRGMGSCSCRDPVPWGHTVGTHIGRAHKGGGGGANRVALIGGDGHICTGRLRGGVRTYAGRDELSKRGDLEALRAPKQQGGDLEP